MLKENCLTAYSLDAEQLRWNRLLMAPTYIVGAVG